MIFIKNILFRPRSFFNKFQFNLGVIFLIFLGLILGPYLGFKYLPAIFATSATSVTKGSDTDFSQGSMSSTQVSGTGTSAVVKLMGNDSAPVWWNNSYYYRKKITITNNVGSVLPTGYSLNYTFDHAALVSAEKSLSSGDDIRFVYWNGSSNTELDRIIDNDSSWNNSSSKIWFKSQDSISASGTDENYYLYYNYASASSPPVDKENIYALWDDFNEHADNTDPDNWREDSGTWYAQSQYYYTSGGNQPVTTSTSFSTSNTDYIFQARAKYSSGSYVGLMPRHTGTGASDSGYYIGPGSSGTAVEFWKRTNGAWVQQSPTGNLSVGFNDSQWHTLKVVAIGNILTFYFDDVQKGSLTDSNSPFLAGTAALHTTSAGYYDDVMVRLYTSIEPTLTSGSEIANLASSGSWESPVDSNVIDLIWNGGWGDGSDESTAFSATVSNVDADSTILFSIKTAASLVDLATTEYINLGTVNSGTTFVKTKSELDSLNVDTGFNRYVQIKASFAQVSGVSPQLDSFTLYYLKDSDGPSPNSTTLSMKHSSGGASISENGWTKSSSPYFSWNEATDDQSGIKGYCLFLSLGDTDPSLESDLSSYLPDNDDNPLDSVHISSSGTECGGGSGFLVSTTNIDFSNTNYHGSSWLTTSNTAYYLYVKAVDKAGNITQDEAAVFHFRYDDILPTNPSYLSLPGDFISTKSATIIWSTSEDDGPKDSHSNVAGLQYKIGQNGTWFGDSHTGTEDGTDLLINDGSYTTTLAHDFESIVQGSNIIYLRVWDNAGNVSINYASGALKVNTVAPSAPRNLAVDSNDKTENDYSFTWDDPLNYTGQANKLTFCYTVNTTPSESVCQWTAADANSLASDSYATQPGENILYLVARDEAGNVNYQTFDSKTFIYSGSAPGIPRNTDAADISIKLTSNWKIAISWDSPTDLGAGVTSYNLYRSITNTTCSSDFSKFSSIGTTAGTTYSDDDVSQLTYYYCVKACDSANNCSAASTTVSQYPTGKYTTAPTLTTDPTASSITTKKATITWSTSRSSDSKIAFGTTSGSYGADEVSNSSQVTSHSINLTNLSAGTTYYYIAKWTDEDGNNGVSDEKTFATDAAPTVKDVLAKNIGLSSAIIQFTSNGASKVKIYYGTSTTFGGSKEVSTATSETTYTSELIGLEDGTKYYYKINTYDAEENEYEGTILNFTTLPKPKISSVRVQQVVGTAQSTILVSWLTNTEISSIITYYPADRPQDAKDEVNVALVKGEHRMILRGLLPQTSYILIIKGQDKVGNEAISDTQRLTTATDTRPPQITDLQIEGSDMPINSSNSQESNAQLLISWTSDEPSTSQVEFGEGTGSSYSQKTQEDSNLTLNHLVIISGLTPSKVYHLRAISKDKIGNVGKSIDSVTITPKTTENALNLVISNLQQTFGFLSGLTK